GLDRASFDDIRDDDVITVRKLLDEIGPNDIFYPKEKDPRGTHEVGEEVLRRALRNSEVSHDVKIWGYRGAWEDPWSLDGSEDLVIVAFGEEEMDRKIDAIKAYESQGGKGTTPPIPGPDERSFSERIESRNRESAKELEKLEKDGCLLPEGSPWYAEVFRKVSRREFVGKTDICRPLQKIEEIEKNAARIVPLLVHTLMTWAQSAPVSTVTGKKEKVVLAIDTDLVSADDKEIIELFKKHVLRPLAGINGANGNNGILKALENLVIVSGRGVNLSNNGTQGLPDRLSSMINIKKRNIIIATTKTNLPNFSDFEGKSFITALNTPGMQTSSSSKTHLSPTVFLRFLLLAVLRTLPCEEGALDKRYDYLWKCYAAINPDREIDRYAFIKKCFSDVSNATPQQTVELDSVEREIESNKDDLERALSNIEKFIRKA
ncbi:MAG: hypothetical protein WBC74_05770, partial [Candidatus Omnitrophota bacterium]